MGLMGSIFGGAVGLALGGPLGALAGAAIGHGVGEMSGRAAAPHEEAQAAFFLSTFSLLARMAKADGRVSQEEIALVDRFMREQLRLSGENLEHARRVFRAAKDSPEPFGAYARQFAHVFAADASMRLSMLDLLARLAMADGRLHENERAHYREAAEAFGVPAADAERLLRQYGAGPQPGRGRGAAAGPGRDPRPYAVLGVEPDADDAAVKARYRKMVAEYHPDKIVAKGLPEEFVDFAKQRFQEIQSAWEQIREERGLR